MFLLSCIDDGCMRKNTIYDGRQLEWLHMSRIWGENSDSANDYDHPLFTDAVRETRTRRLFLFLYHTLICSPCSVPFATALTISTPVCLNRHTLEILFSLCSHRLVLVTLSLAYDSYSLFNMVTPQSVLSTYARSNLPPRDRPTPITLNLSKFISRYEVPH